MSRRVVISPRRFKKCSKTSLSTDRVERDHCQGSAKVGKLDCSDINNGAGGERSVPTSSITAECTPNIPSSPGKSVSERYNLESFSKITGFFPESIDIIEESVSQQHSGEILNDVTEHASSDLRRLPPPSWSNVDRVGPVDSGEQKIVVVNI